MCRFDFGWEEYGDLKTTAEHVLEAFRKPILIHLPENNVTLIEM
ncbi:hypothetical protein GCM10020370_63440 [Paenibacillus hodogayensis]